MYELYRYQNSRCNNKNLNCCIISPWLWGNETTTVLRNSWDESLAVTSCRIRLWASMRGMTGSHPNRILCRWSHNLRFKWVLRNQVRRLAESAMRKSVITYPFMKFSLEWTFPLMYGKGRARKNNSVVKTTNSLRHSRNTSTKMHTKHWPLTFWSQTCTTSAWTYKHFFKEAEVSVQLTQKTRTLKYLQYTFRATRKENKFLTPLPHQFLKWTSQNGKGPTMWK